VVILPSLSERFAIVGQEAIAGGARVARSRIGARVELFGDAGAPFWTAVELSAIIAGDDAEASVATCQSWLRDYQRNVEKLKAEYWEKLEEHCRNGPP
jgi:hypothetical protein